MYTLTDRVVLPDQRIEERDEEEKVAISLHWLTCLGIHIHQLPRNTQLGFWVVCIVPLQNISHNPLTYKHLLHSFGLLPLLCIFRDIQSDHSIVGKCQYFIQVNVQEVLSKNSRPFFLYLIFITLLTICTSQLTLSS